MAVLLCVVLGLVVASGSVVGHVHDDAKAGYYNEQHVLGTLAARTSDSPMPAAASLTAVAEVVALAVPPREGASPASSVRRADPRAPPTV
jgi:hypothetical protein